MSEPEKKTVSTEFVNAVKKYVEVDNKLREIRERNKTLNLEKKEKEEFILNYMTSIDESEVGVVDGKLKKNISKSQTPLKKDFIQKALTEITGDSIKASSMTDHIIKSRPVVERVTLKRMKNRNKGESDK